MRAPPKRKEKTGGPNRAATAAVDATAATVQPASARRSGGPTDGRAHAGGGTRRHAASVPSMSRAAQRGTLLRAASSGAESVARRVIAPCVGARSDSDEPGEAVI